MYLWIFLVEDSSTAVKTEAPPQKPASGSPSTAPPTSIAQSPISEKDKMTDVLSSNQATLEGNSPSVVTGWLAIELNAFIMFLH